MTTDTVTPRLFQNVAFVIYPVKDVKTARFLY
jgi:hypothetical protein